MSNLFDTIIIIGRPGSGKSPLADLLKRMPLSKRMRYCFVGDFIEVDDFIFLSEKFKEDDSWEKMGLQRKYSKRVEDGCVITDSDLWDFGIENINKTVKKKISSDTDFFNKNTVLIEFSRGGQQTYEHALNILSDEILSRAVILHLDITYEESLLRNQLRYKKGEEMSKLHHKVPLEEMDDSYRTSDWMILSFGRDEGYITIRNYEIPFVSIVNQPAPNNDSELEKKFLSAFYNLYEMKHGKRRTSKIPLNKEDLPISIFDHLIVLGRPAAGKSEFIDFIKKTPLQDRISEFHIGNLEEFDDFKILADKFEEDDTWLKIKKKRLYTSMQGDVPVIKDLSLYDFGINQINDIIQTRFLGDPSFYNDKTIFIEFSRGGELSYMDSLKLIHPDILKKSAIFYIKASFDECIRRNKERYEGKKKFGVLTHMVPEEQMERLYKVDDWEDLTKKNRSGHLDVCEVKVPFVTMENEPESKNFSIMEERYENALKALFDLQMQKKSEDLKKK